MLLSDTMQLYLRMMLSDTFWDQLKNKSARQGNWKAEDATKSADTG
jgi:hypothetical protein